MFDVLLEFLKLEYDCHFINWHIRSGDAENDGHVNGGQIQITWQNMK